MTLTAVRPANMTGHDKVFGSVDHVVCITAPALGEAVRFPFQDTMRCPVHVDDVAEAFARITLADRPQHAVYNTGGTAVSLGELADLVREQIPDAQISFDREQGDKANATNYLIDNTRLRQEFGITPRDARECVATIINDLRADRRALSV